MLGWKIIKSRKIGRVPKITALSKLSNVCSSCGSGASDDSGSNKFESTKGSGGDKISVSCSQGDNPSPMYDSRKYGHNLPKSDVKPRFETLPNIPTGIFRCTDGEILGPRADKSSGYPCPEYFSYHHMSFFDLHLMLSNCRQPRLNTGRKP